ncbi:UNVERIFIED_CONTAM: hypothetical protein HDU68_009388 [Siphonaria sp. JEL0065]|nr:hypothetical protein HDU68_009388 [Siphonaria sp. JEL0065]
MATLDALLADFDNGFDDFDDTTGTAFGPEARRVIYSPSLKATAVNPQAHEAPLQRKVTAKAAIEDLESDLYDFLDDYGSDQDQDADAQFAQPIDTSHFLSLQVPDHVATSEAVEVIQHQPVYAAIVPVAPAVADIEPIKGAIKTPSLDDLLLQQDQEQEQEQKSEQNQDFAVGSNGSEFSAPDGVDTPKQLPYLKAKFDTTTATQPIVQHDEEIVVEQVEVVVESAEAVKTVDVVETAETVDAVEAVETEDTDEAVENETVADVETVDNGTAADVETVEVVEAEKVVEEIQVEAVETFVTAAEVEIEQSIYVEHEQQVVVDLNEVAPVATTITEEVVVVQQSEIHERPEVVGTVQESATFVETDEPTRKAVEIQSVAHVEPEIQAEVSTDPSGSPVVYQFIEDQQQQQIIDVAPLEDLVVEPEIAVLDESVVATADAVVIAQEEVVEEVVYENHQVEIAQEVVYEKQQVEVAQQVGAVQEIILEQVAVQEEAPVVIEAEVIQERVQSVEEPAEDSYDVDDVLGDILAEQEAYGLELEQENAAVEEIAIPQPVEHVVPVAAKAVASVVPISTAPVNRVAPAASVASFPVSYPTESQPEPGAYDQDDFRPISELNVHFRNSILDNDLQVQIIRMRGQVERTRMLINEQLRLRNLPPLQPGQYTVPPMSPLSPQVMRAQQQEVGSPNKRASIISSISQRVVNAISSVSGSPASSSPTPQEEELRVMREELERTKREIAEKMERNQALLEQQQQLLHQQAQQQQQQPAFVPFVPAPPPTNPQRVATPPVQATQHDNIVEYQRPSKQLPTKPVVDEFPGVDNVIEYKKPGKDTDSVSVTSGKSAKSNKSTKSTGWSMFRSSKSNKNLKESESSSSASASASKEAKPRRKSTKDAPLYMDMAMANVGMRF